MDPIHYMMDNAGCLTSLTLQHLWLVALAVGLAIIIGVPLGILIVRHKWLSPDSMISLLVFANAEVVYTTAPSASIAVRHRRLLSVLFIVNSFHARGIKLV